MDKRIYFKLFNHSEGVLSDDDLCQQSRHQACPMPHEWNFPKTEADLNQICPKFILFVKCRENYFKKCVPEAVPWQSYLQNLKEVAEDACEENSELHSSIVQNIVCYNEVAQKDIEICYNDIDKKIEGMLKYIEIQAEEGTIYELWETFQCLSASLEIHCYASNSFEKCGNDAGELVLELSRRAGFRFRCSAVDEESLSKLLALLELELEEETLLNRIISRQ